MKSQVPVFFNKWLDLMEEAWTYLSRDEFTKLEGKILIEIAASRKDRGPMKFRFRFVGVPERMGKIR